MGKYEIYTFNPHIIKIKYVQEEGPILYELGVFPPFKMRFCMFQFHFED